MKTLYLECNMGASGDMLMSALLELLPDRESFLREMNALGLPGVRLEAVPSVKCGITGTHVSVTVNGEEEESIDPSHEHAHPHSHDGEHHHEHMHGDHEHGHSHTGISDIEALIEGLPLPEKVRRDALAVYLLLAEAESDAHKAPVKQIHFHEVGALDAVADVVGVCLLIHCLAPDHIVASPVHVGSGEVRCAHGLLPVPAPATACLLRNIPIYGGTIKGELCTPTGAALLRHFAGEFGPMPPMTVSAVGYGMGHKDFEAANCLRAMLGETGIRGDQIVELRCNLDDMTPEDTAFASEQLFAAGALDVYTIPVGMKKGRPGLLFTCMCREESREEMLRLLFMHTTTLGVRETLCNRYILDRRERTAETPYGRVHIKEATGWGVSRSKPEYEDLARIAREKGISLAEARRLTELTDTPILR